MFGVISKKILVFRISEEKFWHNYAYRLSLVEKLLERGKLEKPEPKEERNSEKATSDEHEGFPVCLRI
jgi:hypothetical protein